MIRKLSEGVDRVVVWALAGIMAAETTVVFGAVVARYVFNSSFTWSDEVARGLLAWLIMLGAAAAYRRAELVEISLFRDALPEAMERIVRTLGTVLVIIFLCYTVYYGVTLMMKTGRQVTPVLRIKLNYFSGAVTVGAAIMVLHAVSDFIELVTGKPIRRKEFLDEATQAEIEHATDGAAGVPGIAGNR